MDFSRPRNRYFLALDLVLLVLTPFLALTLRLEISAWASAYGLGLVVYTLLSVFIKPAIFFGFGLYRRYWRYASIDELWIIVMATVVAAGVMTGMQLSTQLAGLPPGSVLPRSLSLIDGLLTLLAISAPRFGVRALAGRAPAARRAKTKRILLAGAGDAGAMIAREMHQSHWLHLEPVGFVDDDPRKRSAMIYGVAVLGALRDIPELVRRYQIDEVVIAMPSAPGTVIRAVRDLCEQAQVSSRIMPGLYELLSGQVKVNHLRNVEIEDLLRREPVKIDADEVVRMISGQRVMVTGGGGSIGSELCRQIARSGPACLTLVGHGENSLFQIESELRRRWPAVSLMVRVGDIRNRVRMQAIFEQARPQLVFHAAAHKHVPLMEHNPEEAVTNNVGGTQVLVSLAEHYGTERFVFISSDKAVNPTNIMGTTKRVAELLVQAAAARTGRPFVAVRFGNVLGSRGSVIPIFREQIARGGPITLTHPDMRRYFMTIPEAVQLVLQAAALGTPHSNGEVFVLDMGEPMRIMDLANDLIKLSGLEAGRDIEIVYTGLRPGEKLFEELLSDVESYRRTKHEKVLLVNGTPPLAPNSLDSIVDALLQNAELGRTQAVRAQLQTLVPSYTPTLTTPAQVDEFAER